MKTNDCRLFTTVLKHYVKSHLRAFSLPSVVMTERSLVTKLGYCKCNTSNSDNQETSHTHSNRNRAISISETDWQEHITSACQSLKNNHIIAVPTDTIYGVAGLAQSTTAVERIYNIKHRHPDKPLAICVGDVDDIKKWGKVTISQELLFELLPGPVTIVLERTVALNPKLNPGTSLVGIRVPDCGFIRDVTRACAEPLALTSANISTGPSAVNVQEFSELWPQLDIVFDSGLLGTSTHSRLGSTVVDLSKTGCYTVIRPGSAFNETTCSLKKYGLVEETQS